MNVQQIVDRPAGSQRRWVWHSAAAEVALALREDEAAPRTVSLRGRVLPGGVLGVDYSVELLIEDVGVAVTTTDREGAFRIDGLDRGDYFLALRSDRTELVVGPIPIETMVATAP